MKVKILKDADVRIAPARVLAVRGGTEIDLPKAHALDLIGRGCAEALKPAKPAAASKE